MSENGRDATTRAHAQTAATLGEALTAESGIVPEHIRRALDDAALTSAGRRALRASMAFVLAVLLLGGIAWSAGLAPSPLSFVP